MKNHTPLFSALLSVFILMAGVVTAQASSDILKLNRFDVKECFRDAENPWIQFELELEAAKNPNPEALNPDFLTNIKVEITLAYENPNRDTSATQPFVFFRGETMVSAMQIGGGRKARKVYFFMPGDVVAMHKLDRRSYYAFLKFEVDGQPLEADERRDVQGKLTSSVVTDFMAMSEQYVAQTEGVLLPLAKAPSYVLDQVDRRSLPSFVIEKK